jgi:DNA-binding transcriptional ArsR family regulator
MTLEGSPPAPELRGALVDTLTDPQRTQVYIAIFERPGATITQLARRLDLPARRVRHRVERLVETGLVVVEHETQRRNAHEHHHRAVAVPTLDGWGDPVGDEERRRMTLSLTRFIMADISRAVRHGTFGTRLGHTEARIPGEVDEEGWEELGGVMVETMSSLERTMIAAAGRLAETGASGFEVICALLLFEVPHWGDPAEARQGPRPSPWSEVRQGSNPHPRAGVDPPEVLDALFEALGDGFRARVLIAVGERPGVTIGQIATRIGESPRRVRHQVERLLEAGLLLVEGETTRRNARERHYRAVALPVIETEEGAQWTDEHRRRTSLSVLRTIVADLDLAVGAESIGTRRGNAVVRIPGEVDGQGWDEIAAILLGAIRRIEDVMVGSFRRLAAGGNVGSEVNSALFLFEGAPWEEYAGVRRGPRPTHWRGGRPARSALASAPRRSPDEDPTT